MSTVETVAAWPRRIRNESEVPDGFARAFRGLDFGGPPFPLVLYSPAFSFDRHLEPATLLVLRDDDLACITSRDGAASTQRLNLRDAYLVERRTELLHSWICFRALGPSGLVSARADFNSVGLELYLPLLHEFRRRLYPAHAEAGEEPSKVFEQLATVNFKFMSLAQRSLMPGAEVRYSLLQNAVRFKVLGLFERVVVPGTMAIATQQELIVIREGEAKDAQPYAGLWTYLPLDRISRIDIFPLEGGERLIMDVVLPAGESIRSEFELSKYRELRALVECVRNSHPAIDG